MGVHEDRQVHEVVPARLPHPLAQRGGKVLRGAPPGRVAEHDAAGAWRVAEHAQCRRKAFADGRQISGRFVAVAQDEAVVLVGLEQLLAPAFTAHHEQAAVGHQVGRCNELPGPLKQAGVELLHEPRNQLHPRATAKQQCDHLGDLRCGRGETVQVTRLLDLQGHDVRLVGEVAEQIQRLQHAQHLAALFHHQPVDAVAQHGGHGVAQQLGRADFDQRVARPVAHRHGLQGPPVQNGLLQQGAAENALAPAHRVQHHHAGGALLAHQPHHAQDVSRRIDAVHRAQEGFAHAREAQRRQLARLLALCQHAELVAQVGEQQRAKGGVAGNQLDHRLPSELVGHHFLRRHKAAADAPGHQAAPVKAIVWPQRGHHLALVHLLHVAFDDDEQVRRRGAGLQNHGLLREVGNVHTAAHLAPLVRVQAVER